MKNRNSIILIIVFAVVFLVTSVLFNVFGITDIWAQLTGTLLGTIITAIVTVLLLSVQTNKEISHDRDVGVFEKKQEVYFDFIETLEKITQDGRLNVPGLAGYEKPQSENEVNDELQHIIYQLGKVQMTASQDTSRKVTEKIGSLFKIILNNANNKADAYSKFAGILFEIVADLRKDLFDINAKNMNDTFKPIDEGNIKETLRIAGLNLEEIESDENVTSSYFDFVVDELRASYPNTTATHIDFIGRDEKCEDIASLEAAQHFLKADGKGKCVQIVIPKDGAKRVVIEFVNSTQKECFGRIQGGLRTSKWVVNKKFSQEKMKTIDFVHKDAAYQAFKSADENGRRQIAKEMLDSCDKLRELLESN